jgi:beta-phosphoglucomutase
MKSAFDILHELSDSISTETIIFFDMDGTLIDTDYSSYLSYRQAIQEVTHGNFDIRFTPSKRFNREELKNATPNLSDIERNKIISLKTKYYEQYLPETKLNSLLANMLRNFNQTNETALVTNGLEERVIMTLQYHGLLKCFSHMFCCCKPSEKGITNKYQNAIIQLDARPESVIVFEDEIAEVHNAMLAGIPRENIIII